MRLIDIDSLKGCAIIRPTTHEEIEHIQACDGLIAHKDIPTAYDVEAVEEELEEILSEYYLMKQHDQENPYNEGVQKGYKCALEVVKKGGKGALRGCSSCKHQSEQLADCEWLKSQGQFIRECYKWKGKE